MIKKELKNIAERIDNFSNHHQERHSYDVGYRDGIKDAKKLVLSYSVEFGEFTSGISIELLREVCWLLAGEDETVKDKSKTTILNDLMNYVDAYRHSMEKREEIYKKGNPFEKARRTLLEDRKKERGRGEGEII